MHSTVRNQLLLVVIVAPNQRRAAGVLEELRLAQLPGNSPLSVARGSLPGLKSLPPVARVI
jgi:hypothetical protein